MQVRPYYSWIPGIILIIQIISHSDGVVRSGTFLVIHSQLERLKTEGVADVFQAVKAARIQRPGVIPNLVRIFRLACE